MADVFLSYAGKDRDAATNLRRALEQSGLSVFQDTVDLSPGEDIRQALAKAMDEAKAAVVVLSEESDSPQLPSAEEVRALSGKRIVVPVLYGSGATRNFVWPLLADRQAVQIDDSREVGAAADMIAKTVFGAEMSSDLGRSTLGLGHGTTPMIVRPMRIPNEA